MNYKDFKLSEKDLYQIAKKGLTGEYDYSGCWDGTDNLSEATKCVVDDFKLFLSEPYPFELGDIPNNPIIYRLMRLKSLKDLNKKNLGASWYSNPNQTSKKCFYQMLDYLEINHTNDGDVYRIKAQTNISNIDIYKTLWERTTQWCENEIVLIDSQKVKIIEIKKMANIEKLNESRKIIRKIIRKKYLI